VGGHRVLQRSAQHDPVEFAAAVGNGEVLRENQLGVSRMQLEAKAT
jgi:hypothetical protein